MPIIVLDTNIVLYYLGGKIAGFLPLGKYLVSVITEIELLSYPGLNSDEENQIISFLSHITVVGLESNIKNRAIGLRKKYKLKLPDAIIVATAQSVDAILLTNDTKINNSIYIKTQSVKIC